MSASSLPQGFARASYWPRVAGLALGFLTLASVFVERGAPGWVWLGPALHGFVWPHVAWHWARTSADPARGEQRNQAIDHFAGGMWISAMEFNALPSVLMISMMGMDSMIAGGTRHFLRGMGVHACGIVAGLVVYGVHWHPESSMHQVLACLPLLILHPVAVGQMTWRALRKLRRQREELTYLSQRDGLSGLGNRRSLDSWIEAEYERFQRTGVPATLALIDFDHFKQINDTLGHLVGDDVIRQFGERLRTTLRSTDVAGRYGGEEFGILLPNTSAERATVLLQRLQAGLRERPLLDGLHVTVSIGVAALSREIDSHQAWIRLADQMLYQAKGGGRDRMVAAADREAPLPHSSSPP